MIKQIKKFFRIKDLHSTRNTRWIVHKDVGEYITYRRQRQYVDMNTGTKHWKWDWQWGTTTRLSTDPAPNW